MTDLRDQDREHGGSTAAAPASLTIVPSGIERLNPDGLPPAVGYCQVTVAQGTRIVHVSGRSESTPGGSSSARTTGPRSSGRCATSGLGWRPPAPRSRKS